MACAADPAALCLNRILRVNARSATPALLAGAIAFACTDTTGELTTGCNGPGQIIEAGRLPASPADARFVELWRSGVSEEDDHLGFPLSLAVSASGRAAIADFQLAEVVIVDPDGRWRGSIARAGGGPGELAMPVAAVWDDAGELYVLDIMKPAVVRYDAELSYRDQLPVNPEALAEITASGELGWAGVQPSGALLIVPGFMGTSGLEHVDEVLLRYARGTATPDTLVWSRFPVVEVAGAPTWPVPGYPRVTSSVGSGGRSVTAGTDADYRFHVLDNEGVVQLTVCATTPAMPLSRAERGGAPPENLDQLGSAIAAASAPARPAAIGRVVAGADGSIWVQRDRPAPWPDDSGGYHGVPGAVFDVFGPHGRHQRTVRLPPKARLQGALGDTIWAYEVNEFDEVQLVAYRVSASSPPK